MICQEVFRKKQQKLKKDEQVENFDLL